MRIIFFGTPDFAVPTLEALLRSRHDVVAVVAQPDRPVGRGMKLQKPPVGRVAMEHNLPLLQPEKINSDFLNDLRGYNAQLGVVVAYGKILPQTLIDLPQHGCINVHASLLPKWRGAAPVQRSIEASESETGVTIMRIDRQLDHGPMFAVQPVTIGPDERAPSLFSRLATAGGGLLVDVVDQIEIGSSVETEQDHDAATYAKKIEKSEGQVRWSDATRTIYDRFRAFDPWPGTFFQLGDETLKILEMAPTAARGEPGTLLQLSPEQVVVATGDGALQLGVLQRPGKSRAAAHDVLRALGLKTGMRLA